MVWYNLVLCPMPVWVKMYDVKMQAVSAVPGGGGGGQALE